MTYELTQSEAVELNERLALMFSAITIASGKDNHQDYAKHLSEHGLVNILD